jgi:hypothetical protein
MEALEHDRTDTARKSRLLMLIIREPTPATWIEVEAG